MRFNTPIKISLFLSAVLFVLAGSLFYVASGTEYFLLSLVLFFWFSVVLIYQVIKLYIHSKIIRLSSTYHLLYILAIQCIAY